jgi:hypothetical protein
MPIVDDKWEPVKGATPEEHKVIQQSLISTSEAVYQARVALKPVIPGDAWEFADGALQAATILILNAGVSCRELEKQAVDL